MRTRLLLTLLLSMILLAAVASAKKLSGTISDPVAFSRFTATAWIRTIWPVTRRWMSKIS